MIFKSGSKYRVMSTQYSFVHVEKKGLFKWLYESTERNLEEALEYIRRQRAAEEFKPKQLWP